MYDISFLAETMKLYWCNSGDGEQTLVPWLEIKQTVTVPMIIF